MSVFDQNTDPNKVASDPNTLFADKLQKIVNEDGKPKYDTVEKALEALVHAQTHIKTLETENAGVKSEADNLRTRAAQADALELVIERLQPNQSRQQGDPLSKPNQSEVATTEQLERLVEQLLTKKQKTEIAQSNLQVVTATLVKKFGDETKAREAVAKKAQELGVGSEVLANLASQSPAAVLAYFGETVGTSRPTTPSLIAPLPIAHESDTLEPPKKSLLLGATTKEQTAYFAKVRESVNKRLGVENA